MHDMLGQYYQEINSVRHVEKPFYRLSMDVDPLSCMITMADVLEEFQRPKAVFGTTGGGQVSISYDFDCQESEINLDGDKMRVVYRYKSFKDEVERNRIKKVEEVKLITILEQEMATLI